MEKLNCGIIGIGGMGALHGEWMEKTGLIQVSAAVDSNEAQQAKVAEKFPRARFFTNVAELLQSQPPDFVVIASPHDLHAPLAIQCLQAGVNVLVEKPMATTYADCQAMLTAARAAGKMLTVFHNRRLDSWFLAAREVIASGRLGRLIELEVAVHNQPAWRKHVTWRSHHQHSGGLLFDWGAHLVDQLLHFDPTPVVSVSGFQYRCPDTPPEHNEDHSSLGIRFASGAIGRFTVSGLARHTVPRYLLVGEDGTLVDEWNWNGGHARILSGTGENGFAIEEVPYEKEGVHFPKIYENIAAHLRSGEPLLISAESAARVVQVLEAAHLSQYGGGIPVSV